jgi:2'-5' RNA ligase
MSVRRRAIGKGTGVRDYQPFIDDPEYLRQFEGQRFIVLRATGQVAEVFDGIKGALRRRFPDAAMSYIAQPHVTLCGFARGTPLDSVRELAAVWSPPASPLEIRADPLDTFRDPFPIVILKVRHTPDLFEAFARLRRLSEERGPRGSSSVALEDWTFHMSVAYAAGVTSEAWNEVRQFIGTLAVPDVRCIVNDAELVAFDDTREYLGGIYRLGAKTGIAT